MDSKERYFLELESVGDKAVVSRRSSGRMEKVGVELEDGADVGGRESVVVITTFVLGVFCVFRHFPARFPERDNSFLRGR